MHGLQIYKAVWTQWEIFSQNSDSLYTKCLYTKCTYITLDNQKHYGNAQEVKTIVKWLNIIFHGTEDTLHVQACENKCTKNIHKSKK